MSSEEIQALAKEAQTFSESGDHAKCADAYKRLVDLAPSIAEVRLNLGAALSAMGDHEGALEAFDAAINLKPKLAAAHSNRANALRLLNRVSEALDSYENAVQHDHVSGSAWFGLAHVANALGKHERAVVGADKCIELNFNISSAHNERAFALVKLGRAEDALPDVLATATETASAKHLASLVHGEVAVKAMKNSNFEKAAENYAAANKLNASFDSTLNHSLCLMYLDQLDAAITLSQQAVDMAPTNWKSYAARGSIFLKMRKFEEAVDPLQKAIELDSSAEAEIDFSVHYNLAVALMNLGREAEAKSPLMFTIEKAPDNWCAKALLGIVHINNGDYQACADVLGKAIDAHEEAREDSSVLYNIGYSNLMLDKPKESLAFFQRAQKVDPDSKQIKEAIAALSAINDVVGPSDARTDAEAQPPKAPPADSEIAAAAPEGSAEAPGKLTLKLSSDEKNAGEKNKSDTLNDTASLLNALDEALNDPIARAKALLKPARPAFMRRPSMERISLGRVGKMRNRFEHLRSLEKQKSEKMIFERQNNVL